MHDLIHTLKESGMAEADYSRLEAFIQGETKKIVPLNVIKLIRFLNSLASQRFFLMSSTRKKELFKNFLYLYNGDHERSLVRICCYYFNNSSNHDRKTVLPEKMILLLIRMGETERVDSVNALIWDFLLRKEHVLENLIRPDQIAHGLWLNDPVSWNAIFEFLFRHFHIESVLKAILKCMSSRDQGLHFRALLRLVWLCGRKKGLKEKNFLLAQIIDNSDLTEDEAKRIWSEFLERINRFEIARAFSSYEKKRDWIEKITSGRPYQTSFRFKSSRKDSYVNESLSKRLGAIQDLYLSEVPF